MTARAARPLKSGALLIGALYAQAIQRRGASEPGAARTAADDGVFDMPEGCQPCPAEASAHSDIPSANADVSSIGGQP